MRKVLKPVLLGVLVVSALLPLSAASESPDTSASTAEAGPIKRHCTQTIKIDRKGLNLEPGHQMEIGRWSQTCNSKTYTEVTSISGLKPLMQRLELGRWRTHSSRPQLDTNLDSGKTYRLVVKNGSSNPVRFDVTHARGAY